MQIDDCEAIEIPWGSSPSDFSSFFASLAGKCTVNGWTNLKVDWRCQTYNASDIEFLLYYSREETQDEISDREEAERERAAELEAQKVKAKAEWAKLKQIRITALRDELRMLETGK